MNSLSHGIGALLAIWGLFAMLAKNFGKTEFSIWGILIYSATLITMLSISAVYHITKNPKIKRAFRVLDHINIYFLIAGTYTPVALDYFNRRKRMDHFFRCMEYCRSGHYF